MGSHVNSLLQVYLIRHGETPWSLTGQHTGVTDLALTAHGEEEARGLAPHLRQTAFTHVLASPRLRARQTCELAGLGPMCSIEPDLAEWNYGDFEGQRSIDIRKTHPGWNIWRDGCPHGDTPDALCARADRFIEKLCTLHGNVAVFSHGQFGAALAARWIGLPLIEGQHFAFAPGALSILGHDRNHPDRRLIELWNETPASRRPINL